MKKLLIIFTILVGSLVNTMTAQATLWSSSTSVDQNTGVYQNSYTVTNDLTGLAVDHFEIALLYDNYTSLALESGLHGWNYSLSDTFAGSGYTDALISASIASGVGLLPGEQLKFAVSFIPTFLDGSQEILQEFSWTTVPYEQNQSGAPVPEPSTVLLLGSGLAGLGFVVRRRAAQKG